MSKIGKTLEAVFAAVAFAEQGEWDEAVRIADGPDRDQKRRQRQTASRTKDRRPRQRV